MKTKWNVKDPLHPTTILRLISEIEGVLYFLSCMDNVEDEVDFINQMKKKYYKLYFQQEKIYKNK